MLKNNEEPFPTIDAITHVRVNLTEHIIKDYDFDKKAFPFRPEPRGGLTLHVSLYDSNQALSFEGIRLNFLPIEPDLAEQWKTDGGIVTGLAPGG